MSGVDDVFSLHEQGFMLLFQWLKAEQCMIFNTIGTFTLIWDRFSWPQNWKRLQVVVKELKILEELQKSRRMILNEDAAEDLVYAEVNKGPPAFIVFRGNKLLHWNFSTVVVYINIPQFWNSNGLFLDLFHSCSIFMRAFSEFSERILQCDAYDYKESPDETMGSLSFEPSSYKEKEIVLWIRWFIVVW